MALKSHDLSSALVYEKEPLLYVTQIKDNVNLTREDLHEMKMVCMEWAQGKSYVVLVDSGKYSTITKEGREYSASLEFSENIKAKALIIKSLPHRIVANLYIKLNKPVIPTEAFTNKNLALKWLQKKLKT